jgi:uncharacterized protein YceK
VKRTLAALVAVLALAGCASTSTHHASHPSVSHTLPAISQKSYKDGLKTGESSAISGSETDGEIRANCGVMTLEHMPITDIKSRWLAGCLAGTILGMVSIDQSNG